MSLFILQPDAAGNCCDCAGRMEPCDSCSPVTGCACNLLLPLQVAVSGSEVTPYANLTAAQTAISTYTADCYVFAETSPHAPTALSANVSVANKIDTNGSLNSTNLGLVVNITVAASCVLTLTWNGSMITAGTPGPTASLTINNCSTYNVIDSHSAVGGFSGSFTSIFLPAGTYYIQMVFYDGNASATSVSCSFSLTSSVSMVTNPIIAYWDDSGTTRQLEACPKMLIPPRTESTNTWYASCADAATAITDHVSNCIGYISQLPFTTFTATDGGTSFTLYALAAAILSAGTYGRGITMWGSLNLVGGSTLTVTITMSTSSGTLTSATQDYYLYDQNGTLVDSQSGPGGYSGPIVFNSSISATARYTVAVEITLTGHPAPFNLTTQSVFTSTNTMSVNPVQALYDVGLDCPARLNCGDSC